MKRRWHSSLNCRKADDAYRTVLVSGRPSATRQAPLTVPVVLSGRGESAARDFSNLRLEGAMNDARSREYPPAGGGAERSVYAAVAFCVLAQLAAVPIFVWVGQHHGPPRLS